jgi:hypothetical protein
MFAGINDSGKEFDVIDEEREVIGSFDDREEASSFASSAPWYFGACNIRHDKSRRPVGRYRTRVLDEFAAFE